MARFVRNLMMVSFALSAVPLATLSAADVEATITQLSGIRLDRAQVYSVRDITISRDVFSITLNRGTLAFTEALDGRVTGAVFMGSGDILAIPPDAIEKRQLFRYTNSALLSERFETAVFRFTDATYDEILKQHRTHASDAPDAADVDHILRWDAEIQRRSAFLNDRILADLVSSRTQPFFLAQIEGTRLGWFDAIYDERRAEEVMAQQNRTTGGSVVWMSFNKRSESRDPAAFAHENKSTFDITSVNEGGTQLRLKFRVDGERVFPIPTTSSVTRVALDNGTVLPFISGRDHVAIVLPTLSRADEQVTLNIEYGPEAGVGRPIRPVTPLGVVTPASYRDEWIVQGLLAYASASSNPNLLVQSRDELLAESPQGGSYESLGPLWIGLRAIQPDPGPAARAAFRGKSMWVMHMLRHLLQGDRPEPVFASLLDEMFSQFGTKPISTFDFKKLAEKHAGKSLDWFFDSWVFGTGVPSYTVSSTIDTSPNGFVVSGAITQSGVPDTFEIFVPVYGDDKLLGNVMVSSSGGEFRFVTRNRPQQVLIDPEKTILTRN
jgi:hypothetical protein